MSDLTTADRFEIVEARDNNGDDVTETISIDRWTKYGKDRLYLNGLGTGDGWISLESEDAGGDRWTKVDARRELDGDELTIEVYKGRTVYYEIVVRVHGEGFEAAGDEESHECEHCGEEFGSEHGVAVHEGMVHSEDEEDEPAPEADGGHELIADGGEDVAVDAHEQSLAEYVRASPGGEFSEEDYRAQDGELTRSQQVRQQYNRDRLAEGPGSATITLRVREAHSEIGQPTEPGEIIDETTATIDDGETIVVEGATTKYRLCLRGIRPSGVASVSIDRWQDGAWTETLHDGGVAGEETSTDPAPDGRLEWEATDVQSPFWDGVQRVEDLVNGLQERGCSPGQAWAYYGCDIRGNSQSAWARRCGYADHSSVAHALEKARKKIV